MWLQLETNTQCNAKCSFCPHAEMKKRPKMPDSMVSKILHETVPYVQMVYPFLYQEPLMEPRLKQILAEIKRINPTCQTSIYTNAALLDEKKGIDLLANLDHLFISFYGPTEDIYRKLQGLDWNQTKEHIIAFMKMRTGLLPKVTMYYIETPELMAYWQEMKTEWSQVVDQIAPVAWETFCGFNPELITYPNTIRKPCNRLWNGLNILSDGTVVPCCLDYNGSVPLGNAFQDNPMKIWNGAEFRTLRRLHQEERWTELPELCRKCTVWKRE